MRYIQTLSEKNTKRKRQTLELTDEQQRKIDEILQGSSGLSIDHRGTFPFYWGVFHPEQGAGGRAIRVQAGTLDGRVFTMVSQHVLSTGAWGTLHYKDLSTGKEITLFGTIRGWRKGQRNGDVEGMSYISQFVPTRER